MVYEVSFERNPGVTRSLQYEIGNGFNYSLSFYIGNREYETRVNKEYLFVYKNNGLYVKDDFNISKDEATGLKNDYILLDYKYTWKDTIIFESGFVESNRDKNGMFTTDNLFAERTKYEVTIDNLQGFLAMDEINTVAKYVEEEMFLSQYTKQLNRLQTEKSAALRDKGVWIDNLNLYLGHYQKELNVNKDYIFVKPPSIQGFYMSYMFAGIPDKESWLEEFFLLDGHKKDLVKSEFQFVGVPKNKLEIVEHMSLGIHSIGLLITENPKVLGKFSNDIYLLDCGDNTFVSNASNDLNILEQFLKLEDAAKSMFYKQEIVFGEKFGKPMGLYDTDVSYTKNSFETIYKDNLFFNKSSESLGINQEYLFGEHIPRAIRYGDSHFGCNIGAYKLPHESLINSNQVWFDVDKISRQIVINKDDEWFKREERDIGINEIFKMFKRIDKPISIVDTLLGLEKDSKAVMFNITEFFAHKGPKGSYIQDTDVYFKKREKEIYYDTSDKFFKKNWHVTTFDYTYGEKNFKKMPVTTKLDYYEDHVWIDKGRHDTMLQYDYPWVSKRIKDTMIQYDYPWVAMKIHDAAIDYYFFAEVDPKAIMIDKELLVEMDAKRINIQNDMIATYLDARPITIEDMIAIHKVSGGVNVEETLFNVYKDSNPISIDNRFLFFDKIVAIDLNKIYMSIFKENYGIMDFEKNLFTHRTDIFDTRIDEHGSVDSRNPIRFEENKGFKNKVRDTHMDYYNNFVYVIHYDGEAKPYYDGKNIDELLLPHHDFDYTPFLSKLLDADGNINMAYVKSYDSVTEEYTINVPVENPIDIFANVGREYLDLDVSLLNIFIYVIRDIWKKNMYKFMAMPALDSIKYIMEHIAPELESAYSLNDHQWTEIDRCMQLFRWYSEMAILNNCEYKLKFDVTSEKVNYVTQDFGGLASMIELNNMAISSGYVLEPIDHTLPSMVTFINNKKDFNTKPNLSLTMYNINHPSSISIIDGTNIVTNDYPEGSYEISEDIKDKIVIEFNPSDPSDNIAIANILVTNIRTPNFTVTYKGKFGEVNSVMQNLLDQMLVVGTVSDELKEKLGDISPVTVAVSTIMDYFEYHHKEKLKGKRLITKK